MGHKSFLDKAIPRLKQHMAEKGVLRNIDVAKFLGASKATATHILDYMEGAMGIIDHVEKGAAKLYFLRDVYDESRLATMLENVRAREPSRLKRRSIYDPILDQFLESGHEIVELTIEGKNLSGVRSKGHIIVVSLNKRILSRGLKDKVKIGFIGGVLYLMRPHVRVSLKQ